MCAVSLAVYLYGIETNEKLINIIVPIFTSIATISTTYIYCFLSENVTHNLTLIGDYFYNYTTWYRLAVKQQKLLILPIQCAQKEFRLEGLGIVECSLRVFSSVRHFLELADSFLLSF